MAEKVLTHQVKREILSDVCALTMNISLRIPGAVDDDFLELADELERVAVILRKLHKIPKRLKVTTPN